MDGEIHKYLSGAGEGMGSSGAGTSAGLRCEPACTPVFGVLAGLGARWASGVGSAGSWWVWRLGRCWQLTLQDSDPDPPERLVLPLCGPEAVCTAAGGGH